VQSPPDGPLRLSAYYIQTTVRRLSGPCFLLFDFAHGSSPPGALNACAGNKRRGGAKLRPGLEQSPPRGRSDGRHPVKVSASLPLRGSTRFCDQQNRQCVNGPRGEERQSRDRDWTNSRTCSRKPNKACHGGHEVSRHSFPAFLQLSSRTVWTSVHHEIRDPKALCASKIGASKAHSLGALLNSGSATRRSVGVRRTHNARPAPGLLGPPV
jgi:hypothetical protein